jgi:hypothetical protein
MPLDGYHKNVAPNVSWLVMPINCALAARRDFDHVTLFLEKSNAPADLILNELMHPKDLIEFTIPIGIFKGMERALEQAVLEEDGATYSKGRAPNWYKLIKSVDT